MRNRFLLNCHVCLVAGFLVATTGAAWGGEELLTEKYSEDYYKIPRLLEGDTLDHNPTFIYYGDNRPGWRVKESFYRKENWWTWKQILIPVYQIYWLGNGAIGGVNAARYKPDYGDKQARHVRDAVRIEAKRSSVDFIIHGGDMATDGRHADHWKTFIDQNKFDVPLALEYPYLPVVGNHEHANDLTWGMPNYRSVFDYEPFYVLRCPDADFFVVDSNIIIDQHGLMDNDMQDELFAKWFVSRDTSPEPAWLERQLAASDKAFKVVVLHHPPVAFARQYRNWTDPESGNDTEKKREQLIKLLADEGVQIVLAGHHHLFEYNIIKGIGGKTLDNEIHIIVSGGAGSPLQPGLNEEERRALEEEFGKQGMDVVNIRQDVTYNYCLVRVASDKMTFDVFDVPDKSDAPAERLDQLVIEK